MSPVRTGGWIALAMTGALALAGPAFAQLVPQPPPGDAAEAPADPARLALARRLLDVQYSQLNLPQLLRTIDAQVFEAVRKQTPNMDQARAERMAAAMAKVQAEMLPDMRDRMANGLARAMTTEELQAAVAFYESPSGRAFVQKMPAALGYAMAALGQWIPRMREALVEAACSDNGCTPEQRRGMMGEGPRPEGGPPPTPVLPPPRP